MVNPKEAYLSDVNFHLVLTFKAVRDDVEGLISQLKVHTRLHNKEYYLKARHRLSSEKNPTKIAGLLIYLNKTCFNGLYRVNKSGKFNAPMGSYTNPNIIQADKIHACHLALQKAHLMRGDFEIVRDFVNKGDFVYFDPPYHPRTETSFTAYTEHNFTEKDQVRLRDFVYELHRKGAYIMLSNSKTKLIDDLYRNKCFTKHVVMAPRFVNCKPTERSKVEEFLITNY